MNNRALYFLAPLIFIAFVCASTGIAYSQQQDAEKPRPKPGKIEGQVKDSAGHPVAKVTVNLTVADNNLEESHIYQQVITAPSDALGSYAIENIPPGKYLVSVGYKEKPYMVMMSPIYANRTLYAESFHPGTLDATKATVVEVEPDATLTGIDITVGKTIKTCRITGRVIDDQTGAPIPKVGFTITYPDENDGRGVDVVSSYWQSDADGEFKMLVVLPGHITIKPSPNAPRNEFGDPIELDITDKNITGLEIKMHHAPTLSGESRPNRSAFVPIAHLSDAFDFI